jgi:hypothetical protein
MSLPNPILSIPEGQPAFYEVNQELMVDLNEVVGQVLQPYQKVLGRNNDLIVRCEMLPWIFIDVSQIKHVLGELIRMIAHHPLTGKKFLHIFCDKDESSTSIAGVDIFTLNIHANLDRDDTWKQLHQESIISLQKVLLPYNARLIDFEISSSGSLFSISLPGKFL